MTWISKWLFCLLVALALMAAPAQANVTVRIDGTDSGADPRDTLTITGEDSQDIITVNEGFVGDVGPGGEPDTCGGSDQLCFLTVEANKAITAQGACQRDGSNSRVRCAYFHSGTARSTHRYVGTINLGGGSNDRARITQDAVADCCQAVTTPWNWTVDFGPGSDLIEGAAVLTAPDQRGTLELKVLGGTGNDIFTGNFDARPTRLFGDDDRNIVNVPDGDDAFNNVGGDIGLSLNGEGGSDGLFPESTATGIDAGPGNDSVGYGGARFENLGPAPSVEGGAGTDSVNYGQNAPAGTIRLDGSSASTGNVMLTGFENATGGPRRDTIFGTDGANRLNAGDGQGDALHGRGGDDVLDVDDANPPPRGVDDAADGDAGEDLILANDGIRDLIECGTSSHTVSVFIDNRQTELSIFDSDRARLDLTDLEDDCEDVEREAVRTPPSARIGRATLAGSRVRVVLRCPRGDRNGCRGRARAKAASARGATAAAGVRYRLRAGRRGSVRLSLPAGVRRRLARRGWATVRLETTESDGQGRPRTQRVAVLLTRRR